VAFKDTIMTLQVSYKAGNFMTSWAIIWRRTMLRGVTS
jgi:hypothetical protein